MLITKDIEVMLQCSRKSVFYNDREAWVKKEVCSFNFTMGAYDGVECVNLLAFICCI